MSNGAKKTSNGHEDFRHFPEKEGGVDIVYVRSYKPLDYEAVRGQPYFLTLTATVLLKLEGRVMWNIDGADVENVSVS